ncbi:MAG TPA: HAMP domain-containing sensor histidine kinase, partial [Methylomirabilota bacterium]|nr:HAMP domain-containing sensor histidine kinase [Methylomirabilota bacterium]
MPEKNKKESVNKSQSDFINLTSHQLRTPLSGIKWLLELFQKSDTGNLTKKQKEFLEKINNSNERMIALVNDLLEVTRIEQGQTKLYLQPTELPAIIQGIIKEKEKEIKLKHLQFSFTIEQEPFPLVRTELNKIRQALSNLINNAVVFTQEKGKININLKQEGAYVVFSITDTGLGIPKDQQARIFEKFYRGTNVLSLETTGTGLGLYIARAFIEASGGKIWFKSEEGKGS